MSRGKGWSTDALGMGRDLLARAGRGALRISHENLYASLTFIGHHALRSLL